MARTGASRLERAWWVVGLLGLAALAPGVGLIVGGGSVPLGIVLILVGGVLLLWSVSIRTGWDIPLDF